MKPLTAYERWCYVNDIDPILEEEIRHEKQDDWRAIYAAREEEVRNKLYRDLDEVDNPALGSPSWSNERYAAADREFTGENY